jgi:hypothetical protein
MPCQILKNIWRTAKGDNLVPWDLVGIFLDYPVDHKNDLENEKKFHSFRPMSTLLHPDLPGVLRHSVKLRTFTAGYTSPERACRGEDQVGCLHVRMSIKLIWGRERSLCLFGMFSFGRHKLYRIYWWRSYVVRIGIYRFVCLRRQAEYKARCSC